VQTGLEAAVRGGGDVPDAHGVADDEDLGLGAAVAQALMIDKLFRGLAEAMNVSMYMWALIVLVGHQLTSFAYPGADMIGEMGLAQSTDVKSMLKVGYAIIFTSMILVVVMTYVL